MGKFTVYFSVGLLILSFLSCEKEEKENPIADFNYSITTLGDRVIFINESQQATIFLWDFGDGYNSTDESPDHTFRQNGVYNVKLTAKNINGNENIKTKQITIKKLQSCDINQTFDIELKNSATFTYDIFLDGKFSENLKRGQSIIKTLASGKHNVEYRQSSNITDAGPISQKYDVNGNICGNLTIDFTVSDERKLRLPCDLNQTFELEITNTNSDPYNYYVNGDYIGFVQPNSRITINIKSGDYTLKMEQRSGYIFYPTVYSYSGNHNACSRYYQIIQ